ncbi:MAG: methyltransferase domain-containing protein [Ferruginibacter sp.]
MDEKFWNDRYESKETQWDLGQVSPPLKSYIDSLHEKEVNILIPGCGNAYEAEYLLQQGFANITLIDIAPVLVEALKSKFNSDEKLKIIHADFFELTGQYDLILEQTFFCALQPDLRNRYVNKMFDLLKPGGKLAGVLFDTTFENAGPPFGGNKNEYQALFNKKFTINTMELCKNSFIKRQGTELIFEVEKPL